jgi:xanthosine utilization system XapX-like protein
MTDVREVEVAVTEPVLLRRWLKLSWAAEIALGVVLVLHSWHRPGHPTIWGVSLALVGIFVGMPIYYQAERNERRLLWVPALAVAVVCTLFFMQAGAADHRH